MVVVVSSRGGFDVYIKSSVAVESLACMSRVGEAEAEAGFDSDTPTHPPTHPVTHPQPTYPPPTFLPSTPLYLPSCPSCFFNSTSFYSFFLLPSFRCVLYSPSDPVLFSHFVYGYYLLHCIVFSPIFPFSPCSRFHLLLPSFFSPSLLLLPPSHPSSILSPHPFSSLSSHSPSLSSLHFFPPFLPPISFPHFFPPFLTQHPYTCLHPLSYNLSPLHSPSSSYVLQERACMTLPSRCPVC